MDEEKPYSSGDAERVERRIDWTTFWPRMFQHIAERYPVLLSRLPEMTIPELEAWLADPDAGKFKGGILSGSDWDVLARHLMAKAGRR